MVIPGQEMYEAVEYWVDGHSYDYGLCSLVELFILPPGHYEYKSLDRGALFTTMAIYLPITLWPRIFLGLENPFPRTP